MPKESVTASAGSAAVVVLEDDEGTREALGEAIEEFCELKFLRHHVGRVGDQLPGARGAPGGSGRVTLRRSCPPFRIRHTPAVSRPSSSNRIEPA